MGLFDKLLNLKDEIKQKIEAGISGNNQVPLKQVPQDIQDLLLISVCEQYRTDETEFPNYFRSEFGVADPGRRFIDLKEAGYIRSATAKESLSNLKMDELKQIAEPHGMKPGRKKDDLCLNIAKTVPEEEYEDSVNIRYWKITKQGRELLDQNKYVEYYANHHPYSLDNADIDINKLHELVQSNPGRRYRDLIWGEYNRKSMEVFAKATETGYFNPYCRVLRDMSYFLGEEGRYKEALAGYLKFIYYKVNYYAGMEGLREYSYSKKVNEAAEHMFILADPYEISQSNINGWSSNCGFDEKQLRSFMIEQFDRFPEGLISSKDLADYVFAGMKEDEETQQKLCRKAMRNAAKELPKYIKRR